MGKWYGKWLKFKHSMSICFNSSTLHPGFLASVWAVYMGFRDETTMDFPRNQRRVSVFEIGEPQLQWTNPLGVTGFMAMWPVYVYMKMSTYDISINMCICLDIPDVAHQLIQYRWNLTTVCIGFFQGLEPQKSNFTMFIHPKNLSWNTVGDSFVLVDFWHFPNGAWRVPCWDALKAALRNPEIGLSSPVQPGKHIVALPFQLKYISTRRKNTHLSTPIHRPRHSFSDQSSMVGCSSVQTQRCHPSILLPISRAFWQHQVEKRNQTRTTSQGNCKDSKCHLYIKLSNKDQ